MAKPFLLGMVLVAFFSSPSSGVTPQYINWAEKADRQNVQKKLEAEIGFLKDPKYGYIRAGYPNFMYLFGRDSLIISWQLLDYDPTIAEKTIDLLIAWQGKKNSGLRQEEPGKIIHWVQLKPWYKTKPWQWRFLPWAGHNYYSVDSTPLFVFLCDQYFKKTGDLDWLKSHWPAIKMAINWCENQGSHRSQYLIAYQKKNIFSLAHQGWKDGGFNHLKIDSPVKIIEVQGYYYAALLAASNMAEVLGDRQAQYYRQRAMLVKESVLKNLWLETEQSFAFALDGKGRADKRSTSNVGHLLFTGILDDQPEKAQLVTNKLFADDLWTPFGIRTHSQNNPDFDPKSYHLGSVWPHDNWIIAQGLKRLGHWHEYAKIRMALEEAYQVFDGLPELYEVQNKTAHFWSGACQPQGWASGALLNFLLFEAKKQSPK